MIPYIAASPVTCGTPLPPTNGSFVDTKQQGEYLLLNADYVS